jgi:Family of unknown function (DUF6263)
MKSLSAAKKMVLVSFAFASLQASAQLNIEAGKTYKVTTTSDGVMEMMGNENANKVTITASIKISGLEKDLYKGTNTITKMTMVGSMMGQDINFDSDKKADMDGQLGQMMASKVNKATEFTVNKTTGVYKETSEDKEGGMGEMMSGGKSGASIFYPAVIGKKQGEKWTETNDKDGLKTTMNYEVISVNGNVLSLSFSSTTKGTTTSEMQGQSVDIAVDTKTSGTITVDALTGIMKQSVMNIDGSSTMEAGGGQSMTIGNKSKVTTTVE